MSQPVSGKKLSALSPAEAWGLLQAQPEAVLVDIRSTMEYLFVGHPVGALHLPWIEAPDWNPNPDFAAQVKRILLGGLPHPPSGAGVPVILICRSGRRSQEAGHRLLESGLEQVYYVRGGFEGDLDEQRHRSVINGWRHANLPWEQC
ncbi:MAG: rhodanese-like domain-containing protein [Gammaproteobacteria bacterium]|nr:rhodanese-like domain-containing protein [Gammaproteobacteria bacterium]